MRRPLGITVLCIFFLVGAIISFTSDVSLLWPGGPLEPMWRLNPRAREGFASMGPWALLLLAVVCVACVASAVGLWRGRRWGHRLAIAGLSINLIGDATNGVLGHDPRSLVGVPIVGGIIAYLLSDSVRRFFAKRSR
jgi:hypothetical protein